MAVVQSEAKKTSAEYSDNKNSMEALTAQSDTYEKKIELQKDRITVLNEALEAARKEYGENSDKVKDWTIKLNSAEAELIKNEKALKSNNEQLEQMQKESGSLKAKLSEITDHFSKLKDKADDTKKKLEPLTNTAQKLGSVGFSALKGGATLAVTGMAAVGTAAVATGKQLFDAAKEAAAAGDAIDEASQRMGVSAEEYQKLSYAAKMSGVDVATLETAAKKLASTGSDMDLSEAINQIADIKDESERTEKAIELFGSKAAYSLGPMLSQGKEGIADLKNAASELGIVMSDEAVSASAKFNDSLDNLTATATAVKNNIVSELLPGATEVMDGLTGLFAGDEGAVEKIRSGAENIVGSVSGMIPKLMGIFEGLSPALAEVAPDILISLADGLISSTDTLLDSALTIVSELTEGLLTEENITKLINASFSLVSSLGGFICDNSDLVIDSAFLLFEGLMNGLVADDNTESLIDGSVKLVTTVATGLIDNIPTLLSAGWELCKELCKAIITYDWVSVGKDIFSSIKNSIKNLFTGDDTEVSESISGSHASGLSYVPYDGYIAELHRGERILTEAENRDYTEYNSYSSQEIRLLRQEIRELFEYIRKYGIRAEISNTREIGRAVKAV